MAGFEGDRMIRVSKGSAPLHNLRVFASHLCRLSLLYLHCGEIFIELSGRWPWSKSKTHEYILLNQTDTDPVFESHDVSSMLLECEYMWVATTTPRV